MTNSEKTRMEKLLGTYYLRLTYLLLNRISALEMALSVRDPALLREYKTHWLSLDDSPTPEVLLRAAQEDQAIANALDEVRVLLKRATKERK